MLIFTKLQRPRVRADDIPRSHLIERLNRGLDRKLTLISAQAGAGKTTLLVQWLEQLRQPYAWLALDRHDQDLTLFVSYLCAAIRRVLADACDDTVTLLNGQHVPPTGILLATFVNQLSEAFPTRSRHENDDAGSRLVIAIDDYHCITDPSIHAFVTDLLNYLPRQVHLALASRTDPPLPLAALRAHKELNELRTGDLRFTTNEAHTLLAHMLGHDVPRATVELLEETTEGWPAGLRLAGLSLHTAVDQEQFAKQFHATSTAVIVDYLTCEVLAQQPTVVREFLLFTSILDRFNPDLCDALYGEDMATPPTHAILHELGRMNLFLVSLDPEGGWFRYHHLFRDLLWHFLQKEHTVTEINALHLRASRWLSEHGLVDEALNHAFAADDVAQAVQIVAEQRYALMNRAQWQQLERYLHRFAPEVTAQEPQLLMLHAWLLYHGGHLALLPQLLRQLDGLLNAAELPSTPARHLWSEIRALQALLTYQQSDAEATLSAAEFSIANTPPTLWIVRVLARLMLAGAYQLRGDVDKAWHIVMSGMQEETLDPLRVKATTLMSACYLPWVTGDLDRLKQTAQRSLDLCSYPGSVEIAGYARYHLGCVCYYQDKLACAEDHFTSVTQQPYLNYGVAYVNGAFGLALTYQAQGLPDEARAILGEAEGFMAERGNTTMLALIEAAQADLAWRQGNIAAADRWASRFADIPVMTPMTQLCRPIVTLAKIRLARNTPSKREHVGALLDRLETYSAATCNTSVLIEVLALQALRHATQRDEKAATDSLQRGLALAAPGGNIRVFADLGEPLAVLLRRHHPNGSTAEHTARILAAVSTQPAGAHRASTHDVHGYASSVLESLTPREFDVLTLLAKRLTNQEIAAELFLAPGTVKTHTLNIYGKLDVHDRRHAVARALELGLV